MTHHSQHGQADPGGCPQGHRRLGRRHGRHCSDRKHTTLHDCPTDHACVVLSNSDKQTIELGLFHGARIHVLQNDPKEPNMVVAVGHARYAINKETAKQIIVR